MRARVVRAALAAVFLPASAGAQVVSLTESEALAQLAPDSPRVQAARAGVDVVRADVLAAGRWPNPRVTFNREAVAGITENMVMVSQLLPVTGRRGLDISAASARAEAIASRAEDQVRRLRADLRLAFTASVGGTDAGARARSSAAIGCAIWQTCWPDARQPARRRASIGSGRSASSSRSMRIARQRRPTGHVRRPCWSASSRRPPSGRSRLRRCGPTGRARRFRRWRRSSPAAETARGEFVAWQREIDAAGFAERAAGRRRIPEPEVVGGTKSSNAGSGDVGTILSVHVVVPLFDRAQPERAAAEARGRQSRLEAEAFRRTVRGQIAAWRAAVVERREIADRYRAAAAAGADEIERIAVVSYEAGEHGILELLDAHRTASSARVRQAELEAGVREAEIELEFVSGWEIP